MERDKKTPKNDILQQMPYSELKKLGKKYGIKGNMKAEKIIAAICSLNSDDVESFSTPAQKEINSCRKNKERKFNEDMMTPIATPRRGTYSVESPPPKVKDTSFSSVPFDTSALNMSNVTVSRGSERKLRRKVSFISPMGSQSTPKNLSIKLRPKTPIASRTPLTKRVSFSSPAREQKRKSSGKSVRTTPHPRKSSEKSLHTTPCPRNSFSELSSLNFSEINATTPLSSVAELPEKQDITPGDKQSQNIGSKSNLKTGSSEMNVTIELLPSVTEPSKEQHITRSVKQAKVKGNKSSSTMSITTKGEVSAKKRRMATPNFKKIHEKAFEKMESIDDYQKRKEQNSSKKINQHPDFKSKVTKAKSKIPAFSGIPFIPSVSSSICKTLDYDLKTAKVNVTTEVKKTNEKKSKAKFDLKSSLSRKLGYKPYKGPVKPLAESNMLNTTSTTCFHAVKEPVNKVINCNRLQTRSVLKGVRTNKRFELQMKNRML